MCEISVIIPVYNVEDYLSECLESISNQTFSDIEIICVDDGSTDSSPDILKSYKNKDSRFKIVTQKNQGLGKARNTGLKHAKGKYIYFIDSDDYLELNALEKLYKNACDNQSDIVLFKFQSVDDDKNIHKRKTEFRIDEEFDLNDFSNFTFTYKDVKRHVLNSAFSACLKLYKKDLIEKYPFPVNTTFEDILPHAQVMLNASKISFVNEHLYYYRSNPNSILNSTSNEMDMFNIVDMVEDYLIKVNKYKEFEDEFIFFKIAQILKYIITSRNEDYFIKAKDEFSKIKIKNKKSLKKYALKGYKRVLKSPSYIDYIINYYELKLNKLSKKNINNY